MPPFSGTPSGPGRRCSALAAEAERTAGQWEGALPEPALAAAEAGVRRAREGLDRHAEMWSERVLGAFREVRLQTADFAPSTGYGYDAPGRDKLDRAWARLCGAEAACVRPQLPSGSAALAHALFAVAEPDREIVMATGEPYDTLRPVIGPGPGSLAAWGVSVRVIRWDGRGPLPAADGIIGPATCAIMLQRSRGYARRRSLTVPEIGEFAEEVHGLDPDMPVLVDNSYAEFTADREPTAAGADLIAGSWTKNPGGGLAPSGGYLAGRQVWVERALARITVPGQGAEVGAWPPGHRLYFQGLFLAPGAVREALLGAVYARNLFHALGIPTDPGPDDPIGEDLVTRVETGTQAALLAAVRSLQGHSPVDAMAVPEADAMPGYANPVVMAAGTFVQGAGLELTADAPVRPPYDLFLQGGLALGATKQAVRAMAEAVLRARHTPG